MRPNEVLDVVDGTIDGNASRRPGLRVYTLFTRNESGRELVYLVGPVGRVGYTYPHLIYSTREWVDVLGLYTRAIDWDEKGRPVRLEFAVVEDPQKKETLMREFVEQRMKDYSYPPEPEQRARRTYDRIQGRAPYNL